jgi:hypothetical protein
VQQSLRTSLSWCSAASHTTPTAFGLLVISWKVLGSLKESVVEDSVVSLKFKLKFSPSPLNQFTLSEEKQSQIVTLCEITSTNTFAFTFSTEEIEKNE